ncbi:RT24A protein, partial [Polyodon spathula]|nr:RT24A protein [Polyodon spathula]
MGRTGLRICPVLSDVLFSMCVCLCLCAGRSEPVRRSTLNRAARVRVGKGDRPVTYEQAHPPHFIAHRKGWLSQHSSNLDGEEGAAKQTVEDVFTCKFILGTFRGCTANDVVIKQRGNVLAVCAPEILLPAGVQQDHPLALLQVSREVGDLRSSAQNDRCAFFEGCCVTSLRLSVQIVNSTARL